MIRKEHTRNQRRMYRIHKQDERIHDLELLVGELRQENNKIKEAYEQIFDDYQKQFADYQKQKEMIDKSIDFIKNGDLLYLANKNSIVYRNNIEIRTVADRLNDLLQILEDKEVSE